MMTPPGYFNVDGRIAAPSANLCSRQTGGASRDNSADSSQAGGNHSTATSVEWVDSYLGGLNLEDEPMFSMDMSRSPSPLNLPPPAQVHTRFQFKAEPIHEQHLAANSVERVLRISSNRRAHEIRPARVTFAQPICLHKHNDVYNLEFCLPALPQGYFALQAELKGTHSLALNVLCGAGKIPKHFTASRMRSVIDDFVHKIAPAQKQPMPPETYRSTDAMHQPLQRPCQKR